MSRASSKHGREQALNFQGFLNDLQEWELSVKDKDKKFKQQESQKGKSKVSLVSEERQPVGKSASRDSTSNEGWYNHPFNYDALDHMSSSLMTRESTVDPASEKELGNEYFKQRKYNEAIDCYSRSIALSPTAVAYANRAMAYLKIKRFQEAEDDCTEALNLDDRYIKAYSRRATARKELGKLRDALEDAEFAMKLEPNNPEVKKQFTDVKSLLGKAILSKAAGTPRDSVQGLKKVESKANSNHAKSIQLIPESSKKAELDSVPGDADLLLKKSSNTEETENKIGRDGRQMNGVHVDNSHGVSARASSSMENHGTSKQELEPSVKELASRAASRAMMEAAKNISPPSSAYQFEVYWRGFSGDRSLQAQLLKVTPPATLPQIFKNALTAPILIDIIKCIATIFTDENELAVKYLENLTKVPRFDMIIMCLPSVDKADLCRTWEEVFLSKATPIEYAEVLNKLHPRYCPR